MKQPWTAAAREDFVQQLRQAHGELVTRRQIETLAQELNLGYPRFIIDNSEYKVGRGQYSLTPLPTQSEPENVPEQAAALVVPLVRQKKLETMIENLVPQRDPQYVSFGFHRDLRSIINSRVFYPVFITGLSGNGKTTMVEQVCADLGRECIRVNISIETDEDDLIGGNTLVDGNIVYREGPVLTAMKRGALLLIDECDRGSNKLMCMQGIMEGKPYFNKKTGEVVHPRPGFNIIATANTKGRGSEDGRFTGAQFIDEAFLERFAITVEQEYPTAKVERKIVTNNMETLDCLDEEFADKLVAWAEIIRKTFLEGGVDEIISTRRLVHIVKAYSMFRNRTKAIELCVNRFDVETKTAFLDLYSKIDAGQDPEAKAEDVAEGDVPF